MESLLIHTFASLYKNIKTIVVDNRKAFIFSDGENKEIITNVGIERMLTRFHYVTDLEADEGELVSLRTLLPTYISRYARI